MTRKDVNGGSPVVLNQIWNIWQIQTYWSQISCDKPDAWCRSPSTAFVQDGPYRSALKSSNGDVCFQSSRRPTSVSRSTSIVLYRSFVVSTEACLRSYRTCLCGRRRCIAHATSSANKTADCSASKTADRERYHNGLRKCDIYLEGLSAFMSIKPGIKT